MAKTISYDIPRRALGSTGIDVSLLGIGGYHLGSVKSSSEATRIVHAAVDAGVNFFDNAWEYHGGESEKRMGLALKGRREDVFLMSKVCSHGRDAKFAIKQLDQSLRRLKTEYLDLWQIHEVVYDDDPRHHFERGGVIEALALAKKQGKVRFTGFTGHKSPALHLEMLAGPFQFDTCQLPLNCFDASFRSFEEQVLPELNRRGIGAIAMKSLCGGGLPVKKRVVSAHEAIRYSMSLSVSTLVTGIDSMKVLRQNLGIAHRFHAMSKVEMSALRRRVAAEAGGGRFELYKISLLHDAEEGRKTHRIPAPEKLKL